MDLISMAVAMGVGLVVGFMVATVQDYYKHKKFVLQELGEIFDRLENN